MTRTEGLCFTPVLAALFATGAAVLAPHEARAQATTFTLDRLRIGGSPDDGIAVWRPEMGDDKKARLYGQLDIGFQYDPFRIEQHIQDPTQARRLAGLSGAPVQTMTNLYADIGMQLFGHVDFQVMFPAILEQTGHATSSSQVPAAMDSVSPKVAAPGDLRLTLRAIPFRTADHFFKLGGELFINAPSGDKKSWAGDKSVSGGFSIAPELDFKKFQITLDTGMNLRPHGDVNDFHVQHEWTWGVGAFLPLKDDFVRLGLELFGSTGVGPSSTDYPPNGGAFHDVNTPLEWMLEARVRPEQTRRFYVGGNAGTRMTPGYAPDFRLGAVIGYWFNINDQPTHEDTKLPHRPPVEEKPDRDGDGIPDDEDACPNDPGPWDPDPKKRGCPVAKNLDSDGDGIPDAEDACPKEPGPRWQDRADKDPKKNGCPEFIRRIAGSNEIQILKQIQFDTAKATIKKESYPIMDEVWKLLVANPEIKLLSIEGHTDNVGADAMNLQLSKDRAKSCLDYLIAKGIDRNRLTSEGYGKTRPLANPDPHSPVNDTPEGRQINRRVEFHIKDGGGAQVEEQGPKPGEKPPTPPANPGAD